MPSMNFDNYYSASQALATLNTVYGASGPLPEWVMAGNRDIGNQKIATAAPATPTKAATPQRQRNRAGTRNRNTATETTGTGSTFRESVLAELRGKAAGLSLDTIAKASGKAPNIVGGALSRLKKTGLASERDGIWYATAHAMNAGTAENTAQREPAQEAA